MRTYLTITITMLLAVAAALPAQTTQPAESADEGQTPTVDQIVHRTNFTSYYQGADGRAQVKMTITDSQGRKRNREFTILRWDAPRPVKEGQKEPNKIQDDYTGKQRFYVYFLRPADVNKMVFMVHKYIDQPDDRWLYLPSLDLVKRISAADKRTSFVGSDFYYEDVSGRNPDLDTHELKEVTDSYYVLRNRPKKPESVEFAYYDMYILKDVYLPAYTMYYDQQGSKYRQYSLLNWERVGKHKYPTAMKAKMEDLRGGGHTILEYEKTEYNVGLPKNIFSERYLRRAPRRYLK